MYVLNTHPSSSIEIEVTDEDGEIKLLTIKPNSRIDLPDCCKISADSLKANSTLITNYDVENSKPNPNISLLNMPTNLIVETK